MPPNRKADISAEDLPTLNVTQLKLTTTTTPTPKPTESTNYWDWPADQEVQALQDAAKARQLVSGARIQANLLQQAALLSSTKSTTEAAADPYWDMASPAPTPQEIPAALYHHLHRKPAPAAFPEPQSYWDWPAAQVEHDEACLQRVLDAQRARHLTSGAHIEAQLRADAAQPDAAPVVASHDGGYWDF